MRQTLTIDIVALLVAALPAVLAGCAPDGALSADCRPGSVAVAWGCAELCATSVDCAPAERCDDNLCIPCDDCSDPACNCGLAVAPGGDPGPTSPANGSDVDLARRGQGDEGGAADARSGADSHTSGDPGQHVDPPKPVCDPESQPAPHWGEKDGECRLSCGRLGGTWCKNRSDAGLDASPLPACPSGMTPVAGGPSWDCDTCCHAGEYTYDAEHDLYHQIGYADGDGWAVSVANGAGYMVYGPYDDWGEGLATVTFRLMVDVADGSGGKIARLDVFDGGRVVAERQLQRYEFTRGFSYQSFVLSGVPVSGTRMEARVYTNGYSYIRVDEVTVRRE